MNLKVLNLTLLYVEDDADTREILGQLFKYKVTKLFIAKDGVEALKIFKENNIHCIISDFQMPKMNGIELTRKIKEIDPHVPFVLLTAFSDKDLLINAIDAGVDKFLQKPIQADKLFTTLSTIEEKVHDKFKLEKSNICLQEAEKIALLSYWNVNLRHMKIEFSPEAYKLFEITETSSTDYMSFASRVVLEDRKKFIDIFEKRVFEEKAVNETIAIKNSLEEIIYLHIITKQWVSSVCGDKHIVGIFQDVTSYENQRNQLIEENLKDHALQISNKKHILIELDKLVKLSQCYNHTIGVVFFDIDNFKAINEKYGHLVADDLLVQLSELVKNTICHSDIFGRWGGDEFVLITNYSNPDSTIKLVQQILHKITQTQWKFQIALTISIGIAFYEQDDDTHTLLERADKKMLEAKHNGKNKYYY